MKTLHLVIITILTVVISISLIIYNYYEKFTLISKQQAIDIAIQNLQCTKSSYRVNSSTIADQLFHVKNDRVYFVNDENIQDVSLASDFLADKWASVQYVWEVAWNCYDATIVNEPHGGIDEETHVRYVDAKSGQLLK